MFEKVGNIIGKLPALVWMAVALAIVVVTFIVGLVAALGGDLGKFKKVAKKALVHPSFELFQATAREMPVRVRKQYKQARKTGAKPSDVITVDACVYSPFGASMAAHFPGAVMAAGILSILLSFFVVPYAKVSGAEEAVYALYLTPAIVTVVTMLLRLAAGLVSSAIRNGGVKVYEKYINALDGCMQGGGAAAAQEPPVQEVQTDIPFVRPDEPVAEEIPQTVQYSNTFGAERIQFEPVEETPVSSDFAESEAQTVTMEMPAESEADFKAKARAEAMAQARAQQEAARAKAQAEAQAAAAAKAQAESQAAAKAQAQAAAQAKAQPETVGTSSADEVIARIEKINREGASLSTMKEVALLLQKERAKPENKTPEQQRKLNEALASLLKAMSAANRK